MGKAVAVLVSVAIAVSAASPASAAPPDPEAILCARQNPPAQGATFKVSGPGVVLGGWKVHGRKASLCFRGVGGTGGATSVVATWTSPWVSPAAPEFDTTYDFSVVNPVSGVLFAMAFRSRERGGTWGGWFTMKQASAPPEGGGGGGAGEAIFYASTRGHSSKPPTLQWQWRMEAKLSAPTAIDLSASMRVR